MHFHTNFLSETNPCQKIYCSVQNLKSSHDDLIDTSQCNLLDESFLFLYVRTSSCIYQITLGTGKEIKTVRFSAQWNFDKRRATKFQRREDVSWATNRDGYATGCYCSLFIPAASQNLILTVSHHFYYSCERVALYFFFHFFLKVFASFVRPRREKMKIGPR